MKIISSKIAPVIIVLILGFILFSIVHVSLRAIKNYPQYEGLLIDVKDDWTDYILKDFVSGKTLTLKSSDKKTFKRYANYEMLISQNINIGDYITKERGFFKKPFAKGKSTVSDLLKEHSIKGYTD